MNGDEAIAQIGEGLMVAVPPAEEAVSSRARNRSRTRRAATPAHQPTHEPTFEERLEQSKREARQLAKEKRTKIPFRAGLSLELHELLVAIARKIGGSGVPEVALRAMEVGAEQWARSIKLRVDENVRPLTTFERTPAAMNTRDYGVDEQRVRDEIEAEAQRRSSDHVAEAERLSIPGRRRANAS